MVELYIHDEFCIGVMKEDEDNLRYILTLCINGHYDGLHTWLTQHSKEQAQVRCSFSLIIKYKPFCQHILSLPLGNLEQQELFKDSSILHCILLITHIHNISLVNLDLSAFNGHNRTLISKLYSVLRKKLNFL